MISDRHKTVAARIYAEQVDQHPDGDNVEDMRQGFTQGVADAFHDGELVVVVEELLADQLWRDRSQASGAATRRMIRDINSGQTTLDLDEWLDTIVNVGTKRRARIRNLSVLDMGVITDTRKENAARAAEASEQTDKAMALLHAALEEHGNMTAAVQEVLTFEAPQQEEQAG